VGLLELNRRERRAWECRSALQDFALILPASEG
jgi:hypothetical protein